VRNPREASHDPTKGHATRQETKRSLARNGGLKASLSLVVYIIGLPISYYHLFHQRVEALLDSYALHTTSGGVIQLRSLERLYKDTLPGR
jgi:hypothetical protein